MALLLVSTMGLGGVLGYNPDAVLCPVSEYIDEDSQTVQEFFECPGPEDPADHTVCCEDKCCQLLHLDSVLQLDIRIAMAISLAVIVVCLVSGIALVICCFAPPCPLYDTCSGTWGKHESSIGPAGMIALPTGDEEDLVLVTKNGNGEGPPQMSQEDIRTNHTVSTEANKSILSQAEHV